MTVAALPYWRLSSFYLFYFALLGSTAPFLALYFDHLGFSSARIGELVAIPMLMRCVAPNIWGWLGDYTGRRLAIVRFGAVCTLLTFSLIFVSKTYAWLAMVMALHAFFWHAVLPQFEVITLAHLQGQTSPLQPDPPVGFHRFHHHRGRARPVVRMAEPRHLSGGAGADHGRDRGQQPVGAERPTGSGRANCGRRVSQAIAQSRGVGVLRLRGADADEPRAVLHLSDLAP